ncbi:hypothetical protein CYMTET_40046 [Cymbomonas tetramitiformis]|uniref:Kinesin light chain n=1 Tax=Cymbomonas tetramitiformis TaxID=36881 RepID=A0AAE0C8X7_9CHLO|nr:hypothetical protein CYMTET_40046 [Cymbomonas tetramitiformis]
MEDFSQLYEETERLRSASSSSSRRGSASRSTSLILTSGERELSRWGSRLRALAQKSRRWISPLTGDSQLPNSEKERAVMQKLAIEIVELRKMNDEPQAKADALTRVADTLVEAESYEEALSFMDERLKINQELYGIYSEVVAADFQTIGSLSRKIGDAEQAETVLNYAVRIHERLFGASHPTVARTLGRLGQVYCELEKFDKADAVYRRALNIQTDAHGPDHLHVAHALNNLASLLTATGAFDEAEELYRRSVPILKTVHGDSHHHIGITLNNLALTLSLMGKYDEALPIRKRCIEIGEELLGEGHADLAVWLNNLGELLSQQEKHEEAQKVLERAVSLKRTAFAGRAELSLITALNNLAIAYKKLHLQEKAYNTFLEGYEMGCMLLSSESPELREIEENLFSCSPTPEADRKMLEVDRRLKRASTETSILMCEDNDPAEDYLTSMHSPLSRTSTQLPLSSTSRTYSRSRSGIS